MLASGTGDDADTEMVKSWADGAVEPSAGAVRLTVGGVVFVTVRTSLAEVVDSPPESVALATTPNVDP
jgi:hypothetical protein